MAAIAVADHRANSNEFAESNEMHAPHPIAYHAAAPITAAMPIFAGMESPPLACAAGCVVGPVGLKPPPGDRGPEGAALPPLNSARESGPALGKMGSKRL